MKRAVLLAMALCACSSDKPGDSGQQQGPSQPPPGADDHWTPTNPVGGEAPDQGAVATGKRARRLTVDQLRRSIPLLFGGATWTGGAGGSQELLTLLSRTLGEADYVEVTHSNTEPNPLFAKFMDDMAGQVCTKAVMADAGKPAEDPSRSVVRHADVDRTLRFLRLKLHGIHVPAGSTEGIAELRRLYDEVLADGNEAQAWVAVCVAMVTAPEFMAY